MAQSPSFNSSTLSASPLSPPAAKSPAKRLIPVLIGGAGLVLLGGGGILVGLNSKLTTLQTSAQQKDSEVSSSEQIAHRYQTTLSDYNQTQAHIQYLETSVSDKSYVPTLLAQLQTLAVKTHLTVSAVRPTPAPPPAAPAAAPAGGDNSSGAVVKKKAAPPPYDTLDVAVDVSGTYADTSMFLYSLTRFPKIVSVDSVQMHPGAPAGAAGSAAKAPGGPPIILTSMKLTAFMFHDAPTGAQPTGLPGTPAVSPASPAGPVPPPAAGTVSGAAGRAAAGAAAAPIALPGAGQADARTNAGLKTL